jgi:hypothetical protein
VVVKQQVSLLEALAWRELCRRARRFRFEIAGRLFTGASWR